MFDRIVGIIKVVIVIAFGMLAGAGCYHHYLIFNRPVEVIQEKPVLWEVISEEQAPAVEVVQESIQKEIPDEEPEEIAEEENITSLELMVLCVEAEAGNQDMIGKRMVASVILNRVDDPDWPDSIEEVISQPYQFTSYWDGGMEKVVPTEETYEAVQMELQERGWPGLFYFEAGGFSKYGTPWKKVGDHYFSQK